MREPKARCTLVTDYTIFVGGQGNEMRKSLVTNLKTKKTKLLTIFVAHRIQKNELACFSGSAAVT